MLIFRGLFFFWGAGRDRSLNEHFQLLKLTGIEITASALQLLCQAADGDARVALNSLELAVSMASGLKIWEEVPFEQ